MTDTASNVKCPECGWPARRLRYLFPVHGAPVGKSHYECPNSACLTDRFFAEEGVDQ